jgi:hypothetical protein
MTAADPIAARLDSWQRFAMIAAAIGVAGALTGAFVDWAQFLRSYLFAYIYWTGLALGCLGILLMHHVVGGKWGMVIRRFCEAGARTLPFMAVLLVPVLIGIGTLYIWSRPEAAHDENIRSKAAYLNIPFFVVRTIFYFAVWSLYAWRLSGLSAAQDRTGDRSLIARMRAISAPGLVVFVLTTTFAFVDWIMSLEPHWFSTIYGAMFLVGEVLESFAFVIALLIVLSEWPPLREIVTPQHLHDLGNMMFAFTILWAYLSFSQFLIIWAGNLPEEIPWYLKRLGGGWGFVAMTLVIFHFAVPFLLLLQRDVKRYPRQLIGVCALMLVVRILDVYWVVEPAFYNRQLHVSWMDFVTPVAVGGIWMFLFLGQLKSQPLVPLRDSRLVGAPHETVRY